MRTGCRDCARLKKRVSYESQEVGSLKYALTKARNADRADLHQTWRNQQARLDVSVLELETHQAECPIHNAPKPVKVARATKVDERPRCPVCRKPVSVLPTGYLRRHRDKQGYPCSNVRPDQTVGAHS